MRAGTVLHSLSLIFRALARLLQRRRNRRMRNNIVHAGSSELTYEIRGIVALARQIEAHGVPIVWENIGDPVAKGEPIPTWMKEIVRDLALQDAAYGYCPTEGVLSTR